MVIVLRWSQVANGELTAGAAVDVSITGQWGKFVVDRFSGPSNVMIAEGI
jgi:hypothetical protein